MNVPTIVAIPIRAFFVLGILAFIAASFVVACLRWFWNAVMDR